MKSILKSSFILGISLVLFASCNKFDVTKLEVTSPVSGTEFNQGDEVHFEAVVEGKGATKYSVEAVNVSNGDEVVFTESGDIEELPFTYMGMWTNDVSMHSDVTFTITVTGKKEEDTKSATSSFHCHPMVHDMGDGGHSGH